MCVVFREGGGGSKTNRGPAVFEKREKEKDTKSKFSLESTHERAVRSKSRLWKAALVFFLEDFDDDGQSE